MNWGVFFPVPCGLVPTVLKPAPQAAPLAGILSRETKECLGRETTSPSSTRLRHFDRKQHMWDAYTAADPLVPALWMNRRPEAVLPGTFHHGCTHCKEWISTQNKIAFHSNSADTLIPSTSGTRTIENKAADNETAGSGN